MKPLTSEQRDAIKGEFMKCGLTEGKIDSYLADAGLLEPEEDALAKAWREYQEANSTLPKEERWKYGEVLIYEQRKSIAERDKMIARMHAQEDRAYLEGLALDLEKANARIARLKSESSERWATDDDIWWTNNQLWHYMEQHGTLLGSHEYLMGALADRKRAKGVT